MMANWMLLIAAALFAVRLSALRRFWGLPARRGEELFLAARVPPDFYRAAGAALLRRYRRALLLPFALDVPIAILLIVTWRYAAVVYEQFIAMIVTSIFSNAVVAHFSYRASALAGAVPCESRPTAVQLSMAPRRLRDHTNWLVEALIGIVLAFSLVILERGRAAGRVPDFGAIAPAAVWLLYLQLGLLLLKGVFVRWRMPLPAARTEDFRRWRAAWLQYHLRVFDAVRLTTALALLGGIAVSTDTIVWGSREAAALAVAAVLMVVALGVYGRRERRRLAVVEREVRPFELAQEFPPRPVAEGTFLAGGLLYFNHDNPGVLVRSARGIAVNLAQPTAYLWLAYLAGLVILTVWQA